ncbi:MAG: hypothetical protein L6Q54_12560 [Leptospiraceae bacterium]|nr:hypothetical protein [Leptospiraceae bacterium]MCK6382065.1 hypothetical protein [Leptospiraceae bacterium]NUM41023.1 hypothetical protein [Leptospiraceae bacterium]
MGTQNITSILNVIFKLLGISLIIGSSFFIIAYIQETSFKVGSNYGPSTKVSEDSPIGFWGLSLGVWFLVLSWAIQSNSRYSFITRILFTIISSALPIFTLLYFLNKPSPYSSAIHALYDKNESYFKNWDTSNLSKKELSSLFSESIRHREPKIGRLIAEYIQPFTFADEMDDFVYLSAITCQEEFFKIIKENNPSLYYAQEKNIEEVLKSNCKNSNLIKKIQGLFTVK